MRLSGGERQRISLARAFLKDAPILILDEPTSSVDVKTEAQIMETMSRLMQGRTSFMIAHRTSTLERCDALITVSGGRLGSIAIEVVGLGPNASFATPALIEAARISEGGGELEQPGGIAVPEPSSLEGHDPIAEWIRNALRNGSLEEATVAVAAAENLMIFGVAGDILERAVDLAPDEQAPFLQTLRSFGPDLDDLMEFVGTVPPARRLGCLRLLWLVCGTRVFRALREVDWELSEQEQLSMLELCAESSDPRAEVFVRSLASPASPPSVAKAAADALAKKRGAGPGRSEAGERIGLA
jgi:energy-coupling factor transporter ATP-binding protein EcfA2